MTITSATTAPLVVIGGVTGNQGRSVLDNLQASDRPYRMRGLTRDASKPKALELKTMGVDMNSIDLKPGNEKAMREAYKGADVVFVSRSAAQRSKCLFDGLGRPISLLYGSTVRDQLLGTCRQGESAYFCLLACNSPREKASLNF
jgi:hypothetical protein